jgi:cytochrome c oxidase subunit 3
MPAPPTFSPVKDAEHTPTSHHGAGGRPPIVHRPTGGGDGDSENWHHPSEGRRGPREHLLRCRHGLFFALAGDGLFFLALASLWIVRQTTGHIDVHNHYVRDWYALQLPPILWLTTAIILLSSFTMEQARRHIFRENDVMEEWLGLGRPAARRTLPWLLATVALGMLFLAGQWTAWMQITRARSFRDSGASHQMFGLIALLHASHVILGLAALIVALVGIYRFTRIESRQILVDCTAWYWHAMGFFWICLYGMLLASQ